MKKAYMIVHELDVNKGGMTTAMLTRSKEFLDNKIEGNIVTFDYKAHYENILKKLVDSNKMDKRTKMFNPFIYFKEKSNKKRKRNNRTINKKLSQLMKISVEIKDNNNISRFFNNKSGEYVIYKKKINEELIFDLFENNMRNKRIHFYNGKLHKIDIFNYKNELVAEQFYDDHGYLYVYRQINPSNGNIGNTYLINDKKHFKNNVEFCTYFLEQLITDSKESIMICDGPGSFPKMLETNHKKAKKFAVIHVNHFKNFDSSGAVKKKEDYILKNSSKINGIVVLTEAQKKDIVNKYKMDNIYVISNFINITKNYYTNNSNIVGHISRLVPQKGLTYLIEVAQKVVEKNKQIEFHLYGNGEEREKLENLIQEKKLNNNVKLLGYTTNAIEKIKEFGCVISTSQFEGQGLSMIEAMLLKKPVIAFDVKYGPSDFIKDGKNGYLIENKNIEDMAAKILKVLEDKKTANELGNNGRKTIIDLYNSEKLIKKWKELLN
ncbi:glycosyltransferase [Staphylococcus epidermidis]|uniref:glycosyltransferase n=1 Tax=Staphylococcus epidermidis TaxID=1282 RepID=UPI00024E1595|nr:glycosyltransferase [Staphylococcus epidermidis]EHR88091.1 PF09318 domain protein [Staphylococcus epidermidis VCU117]KAB2225554.1 glycosyltransferase [Staphylococcus epidermidis]KAB2297117.1 glycosyltransferase [Staphylococcus epidermidis]KAB2303204.1 glycosyltransferase [Staphylococcus epidermidis]MCG7774539.1 glycosyltransferase [Staphylococcus epidermidis]